MPCSDGESRTLSVTVSEAGSLDPASTILLAGGYKGGHVVGWGEKL